MVLTSNTRSDSDIGLVGITVGPDKVILRARNSKRVGSEEKRAMKVEISRRELQISKEVKPPGK